MALGSGRGSKKNIDAMTGERDIGVFNGVEIYCRARLATFAAETGAKRPSEMCVKTFDRIARADHSSRQVLLRYTISMRET